jgi:predicted nuclease of predicted toxin-antitoxin system
LPSAKNITFLADMGISQTTVKWLKEQGFDAFHVRDMNMHRATDTEILGKARNHEHIVLTCDLDFGEILSATGEDCPSVVIFRLENEKPEHINKRLKQVLQESLEALIQGAIIVVEEGRHRIRKLPI